MKLLLALLLTSSILYSQNDSVSKFIIPELFIELSKDTLTEIYHFEKDSNVFMLSSGNLTADTNLYKFSKDLRELKSIKFRNGVSTYSGALYGGLIGTGIGLATGILNVITNQPPTIDVLMLLPGFAAAGFIGGALIGGFIGSFIPVYDAYNMFSSDINVKKEQLRKILYKNDLNRKKN